MPFLILSVAQIAGVLLGVAALAYLALALRSVRRFKEGPARVDGWQPSVSVLKPKPVAGNSPELYQCLRSFCEQDWPTHEIIFGAHSEDDPAVGVVRQGRELINGGESLSKQVRTQESASSNRRNPITSIAIPVGSHSMGYQPGSVFTRPRPQPVIIERHCQ